MNPTILPFLGLMRRAGALAVGAESAFDAAREKKLPLLALANDAGENTRSAMANAANLAEGPLITLPCAKSELGRALGVGECAALAVLDTGFALALCKKLLLDEETGLMEARLAREKKRKAKKMRKKTPPSAQYRGQTGGAAARIAEKRACGRRAGQDSERANPRPSHRPQGNKRRVTGKRGN